MKIDNARLMKALDLVDDARLFEPDDTLTDPVFAYIVGYFARECHIEVRAVAPALHVGFEMGIMYERLRAKEDDFVGQ